MGVLIDGGGICCRCIVSCDLHHVDVQFLEVRLDRHCFRTINARTVVDANLLAFECSGLLEGSELNRVVRFVRWCQLKVNCSIRRQCARQRAIDDWRVVGRLVAVRIDRRDGDEDVVVLSELGADRLTRCRDCRIVEGDVGHDPSPVDAPMRIHVGGQRADGVLEISVIQMDPHDRQRREIDDWKTDPDGRRRDALVGWTCSSGTRWINCEDRTQSDRKACDGHETVSNYQTAAPPSWLH